MITEEQTVLNQYHARWNQLQARMFFEQLIGENDQIQCWFSAVGESIRLVSGLVQ